MIGFDHRKSVLRNVPSMEDCPENLAFHVNVEKSSSTAVYDYFSAKIAEARCSGVSENVSYFFSVWFSFKLITSYVFLAQ